MRNKSFRRHQQARVIKRAEKWLANYFGRDAKYQARKRANHPQVCSSYCCGNPRKWWKSITLQEKRSELKFHDEY